MAKLTMKVAFGDGTSDALAGQLVSVDGAIDKITVPLDSVLTDFQIDLAVTQANLKGLAIINPGKSSAVIKTNASDATGGNTLTIAAGTGFLGGIAGSAMPVPTISHDITTAYITTTIASPGQVLTIWVVRDALIS